MYKMITFILEEQSEMNLKPQYHKNTPTKMVMLQSTFNELWTL